MKRNARFTILAMGLAACLLGGCGFGLSPSWKDGSRTSVSLRLSALGVDDAGNVSRAIMPGSNYLYIRTVGISGETEGALYGPYTVKADSEFITTDIPAGDYGGIFVLASCKDLEAGAPNFDIYGGNYSFRGIMTLPDAQFLEFISDSVDKTALDTWFDGTVSFGETGAITLEAGKVNALSVTLTPTGSRDYEIPLYKTSTYRFSSATQTRHFYRLEGTKVKLPVTSGYLACTLTAVSGSGATLSGIAFYSRSGESVATTRTGSDLASGLTWTIDAATVNAIADSSGEVELYQYMDFSGDIDAVYENTVSGLKVSVDGSGIPSFRGHRMLLAVYESGAYSLLESGVSWEMLPVVGYAIVPLDATTGSGSIRLPYNLSRDKTYYVSAQVDVGDNYTTLTGISSANVATIVPFQGDYLTNGTTGLIQFSGGSDVSLSATNFTPYTDYVYFVSQAGGGTGSKPTTPATFAVAYAAFIALPAGSAAQMYVLNDLSAVSTMYIDNRKLYLSSYDAGIKTVAADSLNLGAVGYATIANGGALSLRKITLDCSAVYGNPGPMINMYTGTGMNLLIGDRATLKGSSILAANPTYGGGVYVGSACSVTVQGGSITNCYGGEGGAIYVAAGGSAFLYDLSLKGNHCDSVGTGLIRVLGTVSVRTVRTDIPDTNNDMIYTVSGSGTWNTGL